MRVAKIEVRGLFGVFPSYSIPLKLDDHITIIHGPNGCGKTTILRIIQTLFQGRLHELSAIRFDQVEVTFDDAKCLRVARRLKEGDVTPQVPRRSSQRPRRTGGSQHQAAELDFVLSSGDGSPPPWTWVGPRLQQNMPFPPELLEAHLPFLTRIDEDVWLDRRTQDTLTLAEVFDKYPEHLSFLPRLPGQEVPAWLRKLLGSLDVHFIQTQRLLRLAIPDRPGTERGRSYRAMVVEYTEELIEQIRSTLAQSAKQSQALERSFPIRVLSNRPMQPITISEIREKYAAQQEKQKRLIAAGLAAEQREDVLPYTELQDSELKLLWMYLVDTDTKLAIFDKFLEKVEVLMDMINSRFLYKKLAINPERGFVFTAEDGRVIPLDALSSGEQHELVLTYELLFRVKSGSMILVDEPELSLHVEWQHRFLDDLKRISNLANLDFLVATHSPQIIHKSWNLAISLTGRNEPCGS